MKVLIFHNPKCSKSVEVLSFLKSKNIELEIRLYLDFPPSIKELKKVTKLLGLSSVKQFMRNKESLYLELEIAKVHDEEKLFTILSNNPQLIERPIVIVNDNNAKICRPTELVFSLFGND